MRSFVHYDADYSLSDWRLAMADKPTHTWRSLVAHLPRSYIEDDNKRLLAYRLLVDGMAGQNE